MQRRRQLIVTNVLALLVILAALLIGWREEAAFGLAVLVILNLMILLRERSVRSRDDPEE